MKTALNQPLKSSTFPPHTSAIDRFRLLLNGWGLKVLSLMVVLMVGGMSWGQTVLVDDFTRSNNTTVGNSWTEIETVTAGAQIVSNRLQLGSTTAGREFVYKDLSTLSSPITTDGITNNTALLTWAFNFRTTRTDASGFDASNYGISFVLCKSTTPTSTGNGYAVVIGQSGTTDAIRLASFTGGGDLSAEYTNVISFSDYGSEYISVKVTYDPTTDKWNLFVESNATAFPQADPRNTATSVGTADVVNTTYTASSNILKYFGPYWNHATGVESAIFDDIYAPNIAAANINWYLKSGGTITTLADWGTNTAGTTGGPAPALTTANINWNISNNSAVSNPEAWTLGSSSKIIVGDGTNACNFTIPALYAVTGTVDVSAGATLTNTNTTNPTLGTLNTTSTVVFNAAGAQTVPIATYGNLSISNTGGSTATAAGAIAVTSVLTVSSGSTFDMSTFALSGAALTTSGTGTLKTQSTSATPLPTGRTWSMDVLYNSASGQTVVAGTHANLNLTGGNRTLIASGTINISGIYTPGAGTLTVTSNTINFNGADGQTIPAATYNILTSTNNTRTLANGVIKIASTFTPGSSNYNIGTSTVEFNGSAAQTIPVLPVPSGGNYYNLTYSGSSTGTLGGSMTVAGNLSVTAGILAVNNSTAYILTVNGNTTLTAAKIDLNVSGSQQGVFNLLGNLSINGVNGIISTGGTLNGKLRFIGTTQSYNNSSTGTNVGYINYEIGDATNSTALTLNSSITLIDHATYPGKLTVFNNGILNTATYNITSSGTSGSILVINSGGSLITANTGGILGTGTSSSNGTINITKIPTRTFTAGANYTFNGITTTAFPTAAQQASFGNPANIDVNANITLGRDITTSGTLSLTSGTLTVGANTLTISGSTINRDGTTYTGNIDASNASATVAFTNTSALTIPASTFTGTCNNITLNGAGGITLGSDLTIGGTLTFTSGKITSGSNKVILTSAGAVSRTSGYVNGNLQKNVAVSATSRTFEIGDASNYSPITLALTGVTVAGDLVASTSIPGAAPASASGIHPTKYLNRYWTLTNSGITLTSFDPTFTFVAGDIQGSAATFSFIGAKLTSSVWTNPTVGTLTSTSSQLTGATSFGDFYLGQPGTPTVTSSAASSISTTGAELNGTVNDNGSTTTPGFDYGTTTSYGSVGTASPSSISSGTGATSITSTIGSLSVNTQYNFRATATNSLGTTNGSNLTFYTLANVPGTPTVNNPTNTTLDVLIDVNSNPSNTQFAIQETSSNNYVQVNGSLSASEVWQTASVWGTKTVTGLSGGTAYAFRVKARNGDNTATSFGTSASENTSSSVVPTISTPTATAILSTTATLGGNVTSDGGAAITARGVVWSETSLNNVPQLSGSNVTNLAGTGTTGVFTTSATSLPTSTQISYSAYATNSQGTSYTTPTTFYTVGTEPSTQATAVVFSSQTATSLVVSWTNGNGGRRAVFMKAAAGSITNPSDANAYTASSDWNSKGTQLGTSGYYCIYDGTGSTVTVTNLSAATAFYVQVFDYNSDVTPTAATINYFTATATGNPANSITLSSDISAHAASFSAAPASTTSLTLTFSAASTITNASGYIILQKSGNSAPTGTPTNATSYSVGNTIGDGTVAAIITNTATTSTTISGLAYATSYSFTLIPYNWDATNTGTYNYYTTATIPSATGTTSTPTAPTITTPTSASVSITTATLGGNVTSDGGDPITERGIVWSETSLNADPVIGGSNVTKVIGTGTTGVSTAATTGLTSEVSISYKAYATNNYGTSYTTVGTFTTLAAQPTVQASIITFTNVGMNSMTINWNNGNGTNRMVVVKASAAPGTPSDGQTYIANTIFGSGSTFGTSEYVVYIGAGNTVNITGLTAGITYFVKVFEYNGSAGTENYLTTSNNTSQTTAALTYYSNGSGDPALLASWKTERNGTGSSPTNFTSGESFVIESGDVMTTTSTWSISGTNSKLQIENGGTLSAGHAITLATATTFQIDNGGIYNHNNTGSLTSTIFAGTEVFGASSNFIINNTPSFTAPSAPGYGNLTINTSTNATSVGLSSTLTQVQGNLTFTSTGTGAIRYALLGTGSTTLNIGGNLSLNGTTALFYFSSGTGTASVTVAGDVIVSSGTLDMSNSGSGGAGTLNIGGNFNQTGGTIKSTSSNPSTINFTGSGKTFTKSGGTLTNANINWNIADGASLTLVNDLPVASGRTLTVGGGTSGILDCSTLAVTGVGAFTLSAGATLKTAHASGISGAITTTNKTFSSLANYEFNGESTGTFTTTPTANTVNDLTINKSSGVVTLSQSLKTNGALTLTSGTLDIGANTLTIAGTVSRTSGNIDADAGTVSFNNANDLSLPTSLFSGNIYNLSKASGAGSVTLNDNLSVTNELNSTASIGAFIIASLKELAVSGTGKATINGTITNNGTFTLNSGATLLQGSNSSITGGAYNVKQAITGAGTSTPTGRFWYVGSPVSGATSAVYDAAGSNILKYYDEPNNTWQEIPDNNAALAVGKGYFVQATAGTTELNFTGGTINNADYTLNATRNTTTNAFRGYNLLTNPYPSYLDWDNVTRNFVGTTIWYRAANSAGTMVFDTYNAPAGTGTNNNGAGAVTKHIAPMQSFWVNVPQGQTTGTVSFGNSQRSHYSTGVQGLRSTAQDFPAFLRLNLLDGSFVDQTILYMKPDANNTFDEYDSEKMFLGGVVQFYSTVNAKKLVLNGMKNQKAKTSVPLTLEMPSSKSYTFQAEEFNIEDGLILLEDKQEGVIQDLTINPTYTFFGNAGTNTTRFVVHFQLAGAPVLVGGPQELESLGSDELTTDNIQIISNNQGTVIIHLDEGFKPEGSIRIFDASGRLVEQTDFNDQETTIHLNEQAGMYFVEVSAGKLMMKKKIVIN